MWIQTISGGVFDFDKIESNTIRIEDIAHALAHVNRYTGHTRKPYNVAQHSVLVSRLVEHKARSWGLDSRALALRGLLHDASEAYLGDVSRPLKIRLPDYVELEHRVEALIEEEFGLVDDPMGLVKQADNEILATEKRDLMNPTPRPWNLGVRPVSRSILAPIRPLPPKASKRLFLMRFVALGGQLNKE